MSAIIAGPAGYPTACFGCPEPIEPGDEIVFVDDRPVHVECEQAGLNLLELMTRSHPFGFDGPNGDAA